MKEHSMKEHNMIEHDMQYHNMKVDDIKKHNTKEHNVMHKCTHTDILKRRWVTFWQSTSFEVGAPTVTSDAYHEDKAVNFFQR
jgi:hypothetical protein